MIMFGVHSQRGSGLKQFTTYWTNISSVLNMFGFNVFIDMSFRAGGVDALSATPYTFFFEHFGTNLTFDIYKK